MLALLRRPAAAAAAAVAAAAASATAAPTRTLFASAAARGLVRPGAPASRRWGSFGSSRVHLERWKKRPQPHKRRTPYVLGAIAGSCGLVFYVSHQDWAPYTGRRRFLAISPESERELGEAAYKEMLAMYRNDLLPADHDAVLLVQHVSSRIIRAAGIEELGDWRFHVIKSAAANAFVLPTGKVFVHTGLFQVCETEGQLAAVLSHELAHAVLRHGAEAQTLAITTMLFKLGMALLVDATALIAGVFRVGLDLPHSRTCESEADYVGLLFMSKACFDPRDALDLWANMSAKNSDEPIEFLSTHPSHATRIDDIREKMPEALEVVARSCRK